MLSVYNYLAQNMIAGAHSSFPHKHRELKDLYRNIVRMSASEPLYKIEHSPQTQTCAVSIKESALKLKELLTTIPSGSSRSSSVLLSSDPSVVSSVSAENTELSEDSRSFFVTVSSLAAGQYNTGAVLPSEKSSLPEGTYHFNVAFSEESFSFSFRVSKDSKNFDLQSRLADFINKSGLSLRAQVLYNKEKGLSRLSVFSSETGLQKHSSFQMTDTGTPAGTEDGVVRILGLNEKTIPAKQAQYRINDQDFVSSSNSITLENGIHFTLQKESDTPVLISSTTGASEKASISMFVDSFNQLVSAGKQSEDKNKRSAFLIQGLMHAVSEDYSFLNSYGIKEQEDGFLILEGQKDSYSASFFDPDSTFQKHLMVKLDSIIINPMRFIDQKLVIYPDPNSLKRNGISSYVTSVYSGMLFNNYC